MKALVSTLISTGVTTTTPAEPAAERSLSAARRSGRPSRTAALELRAHILRAATDLFLEQGYGLTTIEAVARSAGISKRTFYHRFNDKAALFAAVVKDVVAHLRPPPDVPLIEGATLDEILRRLASLILQAALSPAAIRLHRLIISESARFPEVVRAITDEGGTQEAHALVDGLLAREVDERVLSADARAFAAQQFLQMVIAIPQQRALGLGSPMTSAEVEVWAAQVVTLFLRGCRYGASPPHSD